ncbi:MAG: phosphate ABC transporter permease PstA [Hyphomicrobiaceae bacterium]
MTDTVASAPAPRQSKISFDSPEARRRILVRYRNEARFKSYGFFAIALTGVFLLVLVIDIMLRGLPAFWQHSLRLDIPIKAEDVDPSGKRIPADLAKADYFNMVRRVVLGAFPTVDGRRPQLALTRLLSNGAGDELRRQVLADPSLIGKSIGVRALLSDDADLHFKGRGTAISSVAGRGTATPSGMKDEVTIQSSSNDFASELVAVKRQIAVRASRLLSEAALLARQGAQDRAVELQAEAAALQKRVDSAGAPETLDDSFPSLLVEVNGGLVKIETLENARIKGQVLLPLKSAAEAAPSSWRVVKYHVPESSRKVSDLDVAFLDDMKKRGMVERHFNWLFLTGGDSREPELAGIRGALVGSLLTLLVTLVLCLPIGVMAAIYLEEFAPKNRLTDLIEVNINNLAAVPSIVFGLLGLAVFLNFFGLPRSAPLVGGLVLALLVLPTIIIASRAALKAVPPSIKEAALGVGASHQQAVFHHVLPLAMPGIMTGTIIGMAHALGETAPLLMIGMVAFIVDVPQGVTDAATVLPVQIYLWSDLPEIAFQSKTAAAIIVLLAFLFVMNGLAIYLRKRFERRW